MAEARRFPLADFILLLLIVALAGGIRAGYLAICCDMGRNSGPLRVQDARLPLPGQDKRTDLDILIQNVKESSAFSSPAPLSDGAEMTAHTSPGYPWLLGFIARFINPAVFECTVRWGQCVLGALTASLYFLFARRAFHNLPVAILTGLFCALHPFWVIDTATIDDGVLVTFLLGAALLFGARGVQASAPFTSLLYGLLLACLALVRAAMLPFAFVAMGWFLWRSREVSRGWLCATLAFLGFANGLVPWTVRNWHLFHEPIPIVDSAYLDLWGGNHPDATGGHVTASDWKTLKSDELAKQPQPRRYAELAPRVLQEIRANPVETVRRRLRALLYFFIGERWFHNGQLAEEIPGAAQMPDWLARSQEGILNGTLLAMLLLALLGWRWTFSWRAEAMPSSLAVLWLPLPYLLSHAEALAGPRLPLDGVLLCYAAFALMCFVPGLSRRLLSGARLIPVNEVQS